VVDFDEVFGFAVLAELDGCGSGFYQVTWAEYPMSPLNATDHEIPGRSRMHRQDDPISLDLLETCPCLQRERQLTRRSHVPNKKELGKGQSVTCRIGKHPAEEGPLRSLRNIFFAAILLCQQVLMHARDCTAAPESAHRSRISKLHFHAVLEHTLEFVRRNTLIESGASSQVNFDAVLLFDKELTSCRACAD
jgi:hypothetical protein